MSLATGKASSHSGGSDAVSLPRMLWTMNEVIDKVGLSRATMWKLAYSGEFPTVKVGRRRMVKASDLDAWIAELEHESHPVKVADR